MCLHYQEYQKALEDADEKVQLANQIYELVRMNCSLLCLTGISQNSTWLVTSRHDLTRSTRRASQDEGV